MSELFETLFILFLKYISLCNLLVSAIMTQYTIYCLKARYILDPIMSTLLHIFTYIYATQTETLENHKFS